MPNRHMIMYSLLLAMISGCISTEARLNQTHTQKSTRIDNDEFALIFVNNKENILEPRLREYDKFRAARLQLAMHSITTDVVP